ncbi:MAG: hypothetical protein LIO41_06720 [Ruminococcus sp.]|nr:hypothetical protein [Ruminococcus sp.]
MSETNSGGFKNSVCIEVMRVFDSCSDKDCLEDLEVLFTSAEDIETIESASFIKCKCVSVVNTVFGIEPVPFNRGFYSVDITYTFSVEIEAFEGSACASQTVTGTTSFSKKVILFGSDGNTRRFSSDEIQNGVNFGCGYSSIPKASVTVVDPILLDCRLVTRFKNPSCCSEGDCSCCQSADGIIPTSQGCSKAVYVTIGLFSIIQLSRFVTIMVPAADYCIPSKECSTNTDSPCELFEKIKFPTNEFFPRSLEESELDLGCPKRTEQAVNPASGEPTQNAADQE